MLLKSGHTADQIDQLGRRRFLAYADSLNISPVDLDEEWKAKNQRVGDEPSRADFRLPWGDVDVIAELKTIGDLTSIPDVGGFYPTTPIRSRIGDANDQLRLYDLPGCVVLQSFSFYLRLDIVTVAAAMFGPAFSSSNPLTAISQLWPEFTFDTPRGNGPGSRNLRNPILTQSANRSVSAVVILTGVLALLDRRAGMSLLRQAHPLGTDLSRVSPDDPTPYVPVDLSLTQVDGAIATRALVVKNPHAKKPLPTGLFAGTMDQHWEFDSKALKMNWIGSSLEHLHRLGCSFDYL